jgi:CubicO group peptidase (beta-lactamase class C family)
MREVFAENFARRGELGGACCVYQYGEKVVDLWGGIRARQTGAPWEQDTMVVVHSATKGLAAMTLAIAHSRGWLDYEERVATYWPEFAQKGKAGITVRQLLAHQAGLFAFDEPVDRGVVADLDRLAMVLARQTPAWEPGTRQAYHALTSDSMKASCCAGWIRATAASDSSFTTKSPIGLPRTFMSACRTRSRTLASPPWRRQAGCAC